MAVWILLCLDTFAIGFSKMISNNKVLQNGKKTIIFAK